MRLGVPVLALLIIGGLAGLAAAPGGAQELRLSCAGDHDSALTAKEAQGCAEQRFDRTRAGGDGLAEEQFVAALLDPDGLRQQFAQVDEDGDGQISRDEWMRWFGPAHADATHGAVGWDSGSD